MSTTLSFSYSGPLARRKKQRMKPFEMLFVYHSDTLIVKSSDSIGLYSEPHLNGW